MKIASMIRTHRRSSFPILFSIVILCTTSRWTIAQVTKELPAPVGITADPIDFAVGQRSDLAITIKFGDMSSDVITGHPGSRTTSYLVEGNAVTAPSMEGAARTPS